MIGLPAPAYALSDVKLPPPLPEPVLSSQPVPAASDTSYLDTWHLELKRLPSQAGVRCLLGGSWVALGGSWESLGGLLEASKRHLGPKTVKARIF